MDLLINAFIIVGGLVVFVVVMSAGGGFNKETNDMIGHYFNLFFDKSL
jgi:hypothetical protein